MLFSSTLFALVLAGVSQAVPAPSINATTTAIPSSVHSTTSTKISSSVPPAQSTAVAKNGTATAKLTTSNFTDVAPHVNANVTFDALIKPGMMVPLRIWVL